MATVLHTIAARMTRVGYALENTDYLESLKQQLMKLGYGPFLINKISCDLIGTFKNNKLSPDQYLILTTALEDYIALIQKSRKNAASVIPWWSAFVKRIKCGLILYQQIQ